MPYQSAKQRGFMHAQHPGIASRWDKEEHDAKQRRRSSNVGKRISGGSFDSGPSSIVRGVSRTRVRQGTTLARYSGTPGHGRRYGPEPGVEVFRGGRSRVAKFQPTSVLSRAGSLGQKLQEGAQTIQTAAGMGRAGATPPTAGASTGRKALVATGQKLGQATATPAKSVATGGAIGAAGTMAAIKPNQNDMSKADSDRGVMHVRMHGSAPRNYDPEAHRQRRLGAAQATANIGGAAAAVSGGRELRRINSRAKAVPRDAGAASEGIRGALVLSRRSAGKVGAGLAGLAAGEKIRRRGNDPRNRAWR